MQNSTMKQLFACVAVAAIISGAAQWSQGNASGSPQPGREVPVDRAEAGQSPEVADPMQVRIECRISRIDQNGKREVLSRPTVLALNGQQAVISIGSSDGSALEFEVVPTVDANK